MNLCLLKCNSRRYPRSQIPLHLLRTLLLCTTFRNKFKPTVYLIGSTKFYEACVSTAGNIQFCIEAVILAWKSFLSRDV